MKLIRHFSDNEVKKAISDERIRIGLRKYKEIMDFFLEVNASENIDFQKKYKGFYRMRFLENDFIDIYFSFLEEHKTINIKPTFHNTLEYFFKKFNRVECSFISKLLATLDQNLPIWDSNVLRILSIKKPLKDKLNESVVIYNNLVEWNNDFISSEEGCKWVKFFNEEYTNSNITPIKKIDLILWKLGSGR